MKTCTKCRQSRPATAEYFQRDRTKKDGLTPRCKPCKTADALAWNKAHPEQFKANTRRTRVKHERKYTLRYSYNMTVEQHDAIFNAQGGVCAICGAPPQDDKKRRLAVDHDHATTRNRGLLCAPCNHALERIENDPDWGTKALNYLARYIEQTVKV